MHTIEMMQIIDLTSPAITKGHPRGTGITTIDTAASLRAMESTPRPSSRRRRSTVYDRDSARLRAKLFRTISYLDALNMGLWVMDATAISHGQQLADLVFGMTKPGNFTEVLTKERSVPS